MFCSCKNEPFGSKPNTHVCPVCLGLPGAMPVPNKEAIEKAQIMASALGANLRDEIIFERKNYFYPDLPKAFQLTTPHYPVAERGEYTMLFSISRHSGEFRHPREGGDLIDSRSESGMTHVAWHEIHIEEDTAKSMHKGGKTWIDFNKSGVPLLEMVTEPDFRSISDAVDFAKQIQIVARYLEVSEADMEKGHMRLEANISLRKLKIVNKKTPNHSLPNYRVELKNINSFTFMKNALEAEIKRQSEALDRGEKLIQETRGYNEDKKITFSQREKEEAHDYRYFPEPDIPPVRLSINDVRFTSKLPKDYIGEFRKANIKESYIPVLVSDRDKAQFALEAFGKSTNLVSPMTIASAIVNKKVDISKTTPEQLINSLKDIRSSVVSDDKQLETWVDLAIADNPKARDDIKKGKMQAVGVLIGSVMKYSKGKADVKKINDILQKKLT